LSGSPTHKGFFAVGRDSFATACGLGINPAAAFLVLARGSGGDNITTGWSAQAVATYLGLRWSTGKDAIDRLQAAKLVKREKDSTATRPRYKLANKGEAIWLPNTLIDGAAGEVAPVTKMRQTQDSMALRLLVELYTSQNLREDGGVSPRVVWRAYERERVGEHGADVVWRFHAPREWISWGNPVTSPHHESGDSPGKGLFRRLAVLARLGLIEWVPYLFEGPEGEPIHPLHGESSLPVEVALYEACYDAATRCLTERQYENALDEGGVLVPVRAHIEQVQLIGVARLRYRPHTRLTSAWWAEHTARCGQFAQRYEEIANPGFVRSEPRDVA
jgi:hypothetical protein